MTTEEIYVKILPIVKNYLPEDVGGDEINPDSDLTGEAQY